MLNVISISDTLRNSTRAYRTFAVLWLLSTLSLIPTDPASAGLAVGSGIFASFLVWVTVRLVKTPTEEPYSSDVLRPSGSTLQRTIQTLIITGTFLWVLLFGWAYGSLFPDTQWMHVPHLSRFVWNLYFSPHPHQALLSPLFAFMTLVVLPGTLLAASGRTRRSLGLTKPIAPIGAATLSSIAVALCFAIVGLLRGKLTLTSLLLRLIHNFFNNGFSEEFFARGMILSQLRGGMSDEWALVLQSLLFAAGHFGSTLAEANIHGHVSLALANGIALNAPVGFALGVMALRGRSLLQGTIVHVFLDTMTGHG